MRQSLTRVAAGLALAGCVPLAASSQEKPRSPACFAAAFEDVIERFQPNGDLRLASGRTVRLADLRWADGANGGRRDSTAAGAWLDGLAGARVQVQAAASGDRWGRHPAAVALKDQGPTIDLAELLAAEGLAMVDAGERDRLCRPELLRFEAEARRRGLGLWRDEAVLPAGEPDAIRAREGQFALVEGRLVSVGERRDRTYLNFGRDFARDFAASVPKRAWDGFKQAGHSAESLRGRTVRVRGTVEVRRGPTMELFVPDLLEVIDGSGRR